MVRTPSEKERFSFSFFFFLSSLVFSCYVVPQDGETPFHMSVKTGKNDVCRFFIEELKLNPFKLNKNGKTVIQVAQESKYSTKYVKDMMIRYAGKWVLFCFVFLSFYMLLLKDEFRTLYGEDFGLDARNYEEYEELLNETNEN